MSKCALKSGPDGREGAMQVDVVNARRTSGSVDPHSRQRVALIRLLAKESRRFAIPFCGRGSSYHKPHSPRCKEAQAKAAVNTRGQS